MSSVTFAFRTRTFRSLRRHYNYRLFFAGQVVSLAGSWMQNVALAWLVLSLSRSPIAVALLLFCRFVPYTLFGLFAGSVVDRFETRLLVIWTQVAAMLVSAALAFVSLTGTATLPVVYILATIGGIAVVLDAPGPPVADVRDGRPGGAAERRRPELGPRQRVTHRRAGARRDHHRGRRASASASSSTRSASSPSSPPCSLMRTDELYPVAADRTVTLLEGTREGLSFAWHDRQVRVVLVVMTCVGLVGFNFNTLVPLLASDTLHVDARAFGLLSAAFGLGHSPARSSRRRSSAPRSGVHPRHVRLQRLPARARTGPRGQARRRHPGRHRRLVHALRRQRERSRPARRTRPPPGTARRALPLLVRRSRTARLAPLGRARRARRDRARLPRERGRRPRGHRLRDRGRPTARRPLERGSAS